MLELLYSGGPIFKEHAVETIRRALPVKRNNNFVKYILS